MLSMWQISSFVLELLNYYLDTLFQFLFWLTSLWNVSEIEITHFLQAFKKVWATKDSLELMYYML